MDRHDVVGSGRQRSTRPVTSMTGGFKALERRPFVVLGDGRPGGLQLVAHHEDSTRRDMSGTVAHRIDPITRCDESDDVSGEHDEIESTTDGERRQIAQTPIEIGRPSLGPFEQIGIEIHTHDLDPTSVEFDPDATESASGIESRPRFELHDEVDLAMRVLSPRRHLVPP